MIRHATIDDLDSIIHLMSKFFRPFLEKHGVPVCLDDVRNVAIIALAGSRIIVVDRDGVNGVAAWDVIPHPANSSLRVFYETIWCVESEPIDTLLLLRALEKAAVRENADLMVMANLSTECEERLKNIYLKRGYDFLETHYSKNMRRV